MGGGGDATSHVCEVQDADGFSRLEPAQGQQEVLQLHDSQSRSCVIVFSTKVSGRLLQELFAD